MAAGEGSRQRDGASPLDGFSVNLGDAATGSGVRLLTYEL